MVDITFASPTQFVLTDGAGRRTGTDPSVPQDYNEIPDATYGTMGNGSVDSTPDYPLNELGFVHRITDPSFTQNYTLRVIGTDNRVYTGEISLTQTELIGIDFNLVGVIDLNQSVSYNVFLSMNVSQPPTVKKIVTSVIAQQDLDNCHKLNLVPDPTVYQGLQNNLTQYVTDIGASNYNSAWNDLQTFKNSLDAAHPYPSKISDNAYKILYEDASLLQSQIPTISVVIQTRNVNLGQTQDLGIQVSIDGATLTSPQTVSWVPGSTHQISTPSPQSVNSSTRYSFNHWDNLSTTQLRVVTPSTATTYTSYLTTQFQNTVRSYPQGPSFTVDGITYASPYIAWWDSASSHTISTTSPQQSGFASGSYVWVNWSDLQAISHSVTASSSNTFVANFNYVVTNSEIAGWNMLSVPVGVPDYRKVVLYPTATSTAYTYNAGYQLRDTLLNGLGYWLKFGSAQMVSLTGTRLDSVRIPVTNSWNMIGSVSFDLPINRIKATGADTPKVYYAYSASTGYTPTDTLKAGVGYWVKPNVAETLKLNIGAPITVLPPGTVLSPPPAPGAPSTPVLSSPPDGATGVIISPTLSWSGSATSYHLQVSTNSAFSVLVYDNGSISTTSQLVYGLAYSTLYYWRVNGSNDFGTSAWSSVRSFTTQDAPAPPPCNCCTQTTAQLDQFTVTDANGSAQSIFVSNAGRPFSKGPAGIDMPPEPGQGMFHARFQSGRGFEVVPVSNATTAIPFIVQNAILPITISWDIKSENKTKYWLTDPGTGQVRTLLTGAGNAVINNVGTGAIMLQAQASQPCQ
jgi:hypothetical protein